MPLAGELAHTRSALTVPRARDIEINVRAADQLQDQQAHGEGPVRQALSPRPRTGAAGGPRGAGSSTEDAVLSAQSRCSPGRRQGNGDLGSHVFTRGQGVTGEQVFRHKGARLTPRVTVIQEGRAP